MKRYEREKQTYMIADYIIENKATVRMAAAEFGLSKSCIHFRMTKLLPELDLISANKVRDVFNFNLQHRSEHGGYATKCKYDQIRRRMERDER